MAVAACSSDQDAGSNDASEGGTTATTFEAGSEYLSSEDADLSSDNTYRPAESDIETGKSNLDPDAGNTFQNYGIRDFVDTAQDNQSTFALDVDTASYTVTKEWLDNGRIPDPDSVRVEEFVNFFEYDYDVPRDGLAVSIDGAPSRFDASKTMVRIGVLSEEVPDSARRAASLTFVVDVSGSMSGSDRIGLVQTSLTKLVNELNDDDRVAIVTYGSSSEVVLESTSVRNRDRILRAIDGLEINGSTNFEAGLRLGYGQARENMIEGGINRVVLASDGVANTGETSQKQLSAMIRDDADAGIHLLTIGVGVGNFNDPMMEQLADEGDGFYAYMNSPQEADRLFGENLTATLLTAAVDAKIQVDFNPATVQSYRLVGYENRGILDEDFRDDSVDAGELGAGHQATAIYELELFSGTSVSSAPTGDAESNFVDNEYKTENLRGVELGVVKLRWEDPDSGQVFELKEKIMGDAVAGSFGQTSQDYRTAVTAAGFAELLRESPHLLDFNFSELIDDANALIGGTDVDELARLAAAADRLK